MPRWLLYVILVAVCASFVPIALIARARSVPSDSTRIQPVQDMGNQQKFKPQSENLLFADTRAMRPAIPGTEAHGGSVPANIPVTFELTILFAAIGTFLGMLVSNGLPTLYHPLFRSARFRRATSDRFFIVIEAADPKFDPEKTRALLESLGGPVTEVED